MKILDKLKTLWKQRYTYMIIPHDGKSIRQVKLNKLIVIITLSVFTITSVFFMSATYFLYDTNNELDDELLIKQDQINNLNILAEQQSMQIDNLRNTSNYVVEKISELYALEDQVRNMVGLENTESKEATLLASRSLVSRIEDGNGESLEFTINDLDVEESVDAISQLIEDETGKYDQLIQDVEKQLKFLDSKPNKWPVTGKITSKFGYRKHPITGKRDFHKGLDIANKVNTNVVAAGSGIVTFSGRNGGYGKVIIISHGYGYKSVYAHNNTNLVSVGDKVKKGDVIAKLGNTGNSTGPHVHFEVHYNGNQINPLKILESN